MIEQDDTDCALQVRILRIVLRVRLRHSSESCLRSVRHDASSTEKPQGTVVVGVDSRQNSRECCRNDQRKVDTHEWRRKDDDGHKSSFVVKTSRDKTCHCRRRYFRTVMVTSAGIRTVCYAATEICLTPNCAWKFIVRITLVKLPKTNVNFQFPRL